MTFAPMKNIEMNKALTQLRWPTRKPKNLPDSVAELKARGWRKLDFNAAGQVIGLSPFAKSPASFEAVKSDDFA